MNYTCPFKRNAGIDSQRFKNSLFTAAVMIKQFLISKLLLVHCILIQFTSILNIRNNVDSVYMM